MKGGFLREEPRAREVSDDDERGGGQESGEVRQGHGEQMSLSSLSSVPLALRSCLGLLLEIPSDSCLLSRVFSLAHSSISVLARLSVANFAVRLKTLALKCFCST